MPRSSCSRHHAAGVHVSERDRLSTGPLKKSFFSRRVSCGEPPLGRSGGSLWVQGRNPDLIPLIAGHRAQKRGGVPYILTPKENEQAPVIPLCNCCASTRRPIETGPIFRNSFMTFLTHMQFHGLKTKIPALLLELRLGSVTGSPFLIFPFLLINYSNRRIWGFPRRRAQIASSPRRIRPIASSQLTSFTSFTKQHRTSWTRFSELSKACGHQRE